MKIRSGIAVTLMAAALTLVLTGCDDRSPVALQDPAPVAEARSIHAAPGVERAPFMGLYFPAGMAGTGTECPYVWREPSFCIMEPGSQKHLPNGRVRIRDMKLYELAFSWREDGEVEPRKTGYDVVLANAILDSSLSGPTWGTWQLHSFEGELMFTGRFTGAFTEGIPAVRFSGKGVGIYEGQKMSGNVARTLDEAGYNMYGVILKPAGL